METVTETEEKTCYCNECGADWPASWNEEECPYCGSKDTHIYDSEITEIYEGEADEWDLAFNG